jgi:hypothetical protein
MLAQRADECLEAPRPAGALSLERESPVRRCRRRRAFGIGDHASKVIGRGCSQRGVSPGAGHPPVRPKLALAG